MTLVPQYLGAWSELEASAAKMLLVFGHHVIMSWGVVVVRGDSLERRRLLSSLNLICKACVAAPPGFQDSEKPGTCAEWGLSELIEQNEKKDKRFQIIPGTTPGYRSAINDFNVVP